MAEAPDTIVHQAAQQFSAYGRHLQVRPYGSGNVNDTFLVTPKAAPDKSFILQRLNTTVFPEPGLVMHNLRVLTNHLEQHWQEPGGAVKRRWEWPRIIPTREGEDSWVDARGSFWRALSFIPAAHTVDFIRQESQAWEMGFALGRFHLCVSDLPPQSLADTLPNFHVTPAYLQSYDSIRERAPIPKAPEAVYAQAFINERRGWVNILEEAKQAGTLVLRTIHGDPKVNNVMLDNTTGQAVGLIDLDTVKPGLCHYDLGDCLRSGGNPLGEETTAWDQIQFDHHRARAILSGYLSQARSFLTAADYDYLADSVRLITFELGLRFFTDYLAGNVYFHVNHPQQNLWRAVVQFKLTASIEAQEAALRRLVKELR